MAEYIAREVLLAQLRAMESYNVSPMYRRGYDDCVATVLNAPAADVAPVVHGRWGTGRFNLETGNYEEQCTRCRNFSEEYGKPYCPNCSAKMDGGTE